MPSPRLLAALVWTAVLWPPVGTAQERQELRWGGDAEGGAPFVEADPADPARVVGFDVEVAQLLAAGLDRTPRFVQVGFTSLDASATRGDFDVGLSGIEDSPARRARLSVTIPYYEFREILTVRAADRDRFRTLEDLRGRRVGTLGATLAYDLLVNAQAEYGIEPVTVRRRRAPVQRPCAWTSGRGRARLCPGGARRTPERRTVQSAG